MALINFFKKYGLIILFSGICMGCDYSGEDVLSWKEVKGQLRTLGFNVYERPVAISSEVLKKIYSATGNKEKTVRLIHFWATWCLPCRKELPELNYLAQELKDEKLQLVSVSVDEENKEVIKFLKKNTFLFSDIRDSKKALANQFGVKQLPTTILLDQRGQVLGVAIGSLQWKNENILKFLRRLSRSQPMNNG